MLRKLAPLAILLAFACHKTEKPAAHPPVILISIDTLRSDHLPAYGYRAIRTPNIDRLAADSIVFEHAYSNVPLTLPSHTTIMTGLLPAHHGVRDNAGFRVAASTPTIAGILHASGYATGAAVSAYTLRRDTNINSGFDDYDDSIEFVEGAPTGNLQRPGDQTAAIAQRWIAAHATKPFFCFVHLFEPHAPYEPSYDGEIEKSDRIVGGILDSLRRSGIYDNAVIVLLSDHGEGLLDHGEQEHGVLLYRESLQVPLIIKLPHGARRGERVSASAQLADVLPTIAEAARVAPPQHLDGRSLLSSSSPRAILSETLYPRIHLGWSDLRSLVRYPWHLIDGPKPELYDVSSDARETHDAREASRREYAALQQELAAVPRENDAAAPVVSDEEREKLASLGYISAGPATVQSNLNPRDHIADLAELKAVTELMSRRDFHAAAQRMEALLARNPGWSDLRDNLGVAYEETGDVRRAEETYRDGIRVTPELAPEFALSLASLYLREGRLDDAASHAQLAKSSNPAGAAEVLARIAAARNDFDTALREANEMRRFPAHAMDADLLIAQLDVAKGDPAAAADALRSVATRSQSEHAPLPRRYWFVAGDTFARLGRTAEATDAFERCITTDATDRDCYIGLAFARHAVHDEDGAARALDRMIAALPQSRRDAEEIRRRWK